MEKTSWNFHGLGSRSRRSAVKDTLIKNNLDIVIFLESKIEIFLGAFGGLGIGVRRPYLSVVDPSGILIVGDDRVVGKLQVLFRVFDDNDEWLSLWGSMVLSPRFRWSFVGVNWFVWVVFAKLLWEVILPLMDLLQKS